MADAGDKKRKLGTGENPDRPPKKYAKLGSAGKKQWRTPHGTQAQQGVENLRIEAGDVGIFATCSRRKERSCVAELKDLFDEYAEEIYNISEGDPSNAAKNEESSDDIAATIAAELEAIKASKTNSPFTNIKLDVECVVFLKTREPVEPVTFVHQICKDAAHSHRKQSRFIRKLTPMTLFGKASEKGLEEVAQKVLAPHFHGDSPAGQKFAIRPNFRNHTVMKRDEVIKQVATAVGPNHQVDLKNYDKLILIEVHKNVLGMSVVGSDYDQLKRFNIAELYQNDSKEDDAV